MNTEINPFNIMISDVVIYDNDFEIIMEEPRLTLFLNHEFFDMETTQNMYQLPVNKNGIINGPIYENTMYITETYKKKNVTKKEIKCACEIYEEILTRRKLEEELLKTNKLIKMPKNKIN